jgi:hypothetical protein
MRSALPSSFDQTLARHAAITRMQETRLTGQRHRSGHAVLAGSVTQTMIEKLLFPSTENEQTAASGRFCFATPNGGY